MTIRVRGIYATALTELFASEGDSDSGDAANDADDPLGVVQASGAIDARFDDYEFPTEPARATAATTDDRQGVGLIGDPATVADAASLLADVGIDTLVWRDPTPRGAIFDGEVSETLGSGAIVDLGRSNAAGAGDQRLEEYRMAHSEGTGFLPYSNSDDRIEEGDAVRVQVREPQPPWVDDRPILDTTLHVDRSLLTLQRGGVAGTGGPHLGDVLPEDPPENWGVRWERASEDAGLDGLGDALDRAAERADEIEAALAGATDDPDPSRELFDGDATVWVWFGRESRFALDDIRRAVTATMPGHHRTKAGANAASAAVDFVESLCPDLEAPNESDEGAGDDADFPFDVVTDHFGPREDDRVAIHHGKPDGRLITLGRAEVEHLDDDGSVTIKRELSSSGTYDGLGTRRERGDTATTKIVEGRWWYPTVYRSADGVHRGTYVNVCTPVEVFPNTVRYVDLHVDVVKRPDGEVERVDDDELDAAEEHGELPAELAEKARTVASALERAL